MLSATLFKVLLVIKMLLLVILKGVCKHIFLFLKLA